MKQKLYYGLICLSMFLSMIIYAKEKDEIPGSAIFVMAKQQDLFVKEKILVHHDELSKISLKIPQLDGLKDEKFQKLMNRYWERQALVLKKETLKSAKENYQTTQDKKTFVPYEALSYYTIKPSPNQYLSVGTFEYRYTGGAHGLTYHTYLTIDKELNKIVVLKDLFPDDSDYVQKINKEIKKQIHVRKAGNQSFFEGVGGFESISKAQQFYLNEKGELVIVFNIYEIAPYASGIIEFIIPFESLK